MNESIYKKLVDLYAADELSTELMEELETAATTDTELRNDMASLKATVQSLRQSAAPEFTEDAFQRILIKMYRKGVDIQPQAPPATFMQLQLPIQG